MLKPIADLSAKHLFNDHGGLDESICWALYEQYQKDRSKCVFMLGDYEELKTTRRLWIINCFVRYSAKNPQYSWDVLSKQKHDWDNAINEENKEHTEWVIEQPKRVKALMDYKEIVIPQDIAIFIILLANPEPKVVSIDPSNIDGTFAVAYKSRIVACINCAIYRWNSGWKLIDVTEKELQEHCETPWHQDALRHPCT